MGWTSRDDTTACCGDEPGAVLDGEEIARLIHSTTVPPEFEPFKRQDFYPRNRDKSFDNSCGVADGTSITRLAGKDDAAVCGQAAVLARGREPKGALVAIAGDVREIKVPDTDNQAIFIYDDPNGEDRGHAVMRASEAISKGRFDEVRLKLHGAFRTRISQEARRHPR